MAIPRFVVEESKVPSWSPDPPYYRVKDTEAKEFFLPSDAVSLRFRHADNAQKVCDILNQEWVEFFLNPY